MKVKDTSGKLHSWNLNGHQVKANETKPRSSLHLAARELLKQEFITDSILEEVCLPGEQLFLDFYVPRRKLAVEVHGEQHYKFIKHFHGTLLNFKNSQANDLRKEEWCKINNITLIILPFDKDINEWRTTVRNAS